MNIVSDLTEWQLIKKNWPGKSIGLVPTMGNLHQGHMSLYQRARAENEVIISSIFVNPTQFNQTSDFECYPRTLEQDLALLHASQVDYVLIPTPAAMYPDDYQIKITESKLSSELEGKFRPEHFTGMLTIVLKLLNLVQPTRAYFGEKDYQQLLLIKKLVRALFLSIEIVGCPTIRAQDGLALSSRNVRLTHEQREKAALFPRWLHSNNDIQTIMTELQNCGFKVDYIAEKWQRRLGAVWLGEVRLIDNIALE